MPDGTNSRQNVTSRPKVVQATAMTAFASVIDFFEIPDHEELNPRVLDAIAAWRATDGGITTSNKLGWHSRRDLFSRQEPALIELVDRFKMAILAGIRRYWPEFDPATGRLSVEGWVNVNPKGAFNSPHAHSSHHLSGAYYVSVPESSEPWSGKIDFLTPLGAITTEGQFGKRMIDTTISIAPKAGQLVLFPSYLPHWVMPNHEDQERVTIAFNVYVAD